MWRPSTSGTSVSAPTTGRSGTDAGRTGVPTAGARGRDRTVLGTWASWTRDPQAGSALADAGRRPPGRHPGHPIAEEGLPASEPGLVAGALDLFSACHRVRPSRG